jgi:PQQ-dependent catabolism-associated beta-propeller protein
MSKNFLVPALVLALAGCHSTPTAPKPAYLVYVSNEGSGDMTVIDPDKPEPLATIPLGKRPRGIHAAPGFIYVALSGSPSAPPGVDESTLPPPDKSADGIGVFDLQQQKIVRKLFGGSDPEQFALSRDNKRIYVSNEDAAGVSIIDLSEGKVLGNIKTGEEPEGVTLSPDGRFVFVTSEDEGTVAVIDVAAGKTIKTIKVGRRPRSVAFLPDGSRAFVTNENDAAVTVLDVARLDAVRSIPLEPGMKPMGTAMSRDGSKLYVSTGRGKKVAIIDTASEKVVGAMEVGQRPWGIALSPDEKLLFTANGPSNDISVVDLATKTVLRKIKAGDKPWGVLVLTADMGAAIPRQQAHENAAAPAARAPEQYYHADAANSGKLRGEARFDGKVPAPKRISMDAEKACQDMHKSAVYDNQVLVNDQGGLANVFVYIKSGLEGKVFEPSTQTVMLDQKGCQFVPRVIGIRTGQTLSVRNSDPVSHNIHPKPQNNRDWNQQQGPKEPDLERRFARPEVMIPVKCDVHAWMRSYIGVLDNPFFAVTDANGSFAIDGIPAGRYTIAAWHEVFGEITQNVIVARGEGTSIKFVFKK